MKLKHFDYYQTLAELDFDIDLFTAGVELIDVKYQTIIVDGFERFTAVVSYNEKEDGLF